MASYLRHAASVLVTLILLGAGPQQSEPKPDTTSILGTWQLVSGGRRQLDKLGVLVKWEFRDGNISVTLDNNRIPTSKSPYRLYVNTSPKQIEQEIQGGAKEIRHGIYSLDKDRLRIRFTVGGGAAPKEFSAEEDLVFKRVSNSAPKKDR